jgi:virginiamycin B lyase
MWLAEQELLTEPEASPLRDAQAGDLKAFEILLEPLLDPAYRLAVVMLQDRTEAEDVLQEAAFRAWKSIRSFRRDPASLKPWFLTIVANQCRQTRRTRWWSVLRGPTLHIASPATSTTSNKAAPSAPKGTVPSGLVEYHVPELSSVGQVTSGPDGNLWFIGGSGGPPNGSTEVVGRITPSGQIKLYNLPGNPGESFDGIAAGPDGNVWFTEAAADKIGRLAPGTGRIDVFSVPLSPLLSAQRNTQTADIVAGPDGNVWFNVDQIAGESVMPDGYVGRITPTGAIKLFAVPGGGQPEGIQVGADGNLWSRIAVSQDSTSCGAIPGYTPSAEVVRVTPAGGVTLLSENSTQFAGYSVGPDGNYWWMTSTGMMRRTTPSGQVKDFPAFTRLGFWDPAHFVFGPDNNIWYVDGSSIDRMTLAGDVTLYHAPGGNSGATSITAGPDGRLWFAEGDSGAATIGAFPPPTG